MSAWVSPPQLRVSHMVQPAAIIATAASTALPPRSKIMAPAVTDSGLPVIAIQCMACRGGFSVRICAVRTAGVERKRKTDTSRRIIGNSVASVYALQLPGGPAFLFHCVRPSVLPRGLRPGRSGGASSAALRRACACDRAGRPAVGPLAVPFATLRVIDTPPRDARSGPARSSAIGLRPLGGFAPTLPFWEALLRFFALTRTPDFSRASEWWAGGLLSAPRVERLLLRRARGPRARLAAGRRWLRPRASPREENSEGPGGEARSWVAAGGASGRSERGRAR